MTQLQVAKIQQREMWWDRAMLSTFSLIQISCIILFFIHDSQNGSILFSVVTTFVKSVIIGALTIELLRLTDRLIKKYWLYSHFPDSTQHSHSM